MDGLPIHDAAAATGWSPRMLRYLERVGLLEPPRTEAGHRKFGPGEIDRLRTLRQLLDRFGCGLSDVAFAKRMRDDAELRHALDAWLEDAPADRPSEGSPPFEDAPADRPSEGSPPFGGAPDHPLPAPAPTAERLTVPTLALGDR